METTDGLHVFDKKIWNQIQKDICYHYPYKDVSFIKVYTTLNSFNITIKNNSIFYIPKSIFSDNPTRHILKFLKQFRKTLPKGP